MFVLNSAGTSLAEGPDMQRRLGRVMRGVSMVLLLQCSGCLFGAWGEEQNDGTSCHYQTPVAAGAQVYGYDPQKLLAPFFGTWRGPLVWADGMDPKQTQLTLTVSHQTPETLFSNDCPDGVFTYADASLKSDDGAVDAKTSASVTAKLPSNPEYEESAGLSVDGLGQPASDGPIAARIAGLDRYTDGDLVLSLAWDWTNSKPKSGVLSFSGTSKATGILETFAIATWQPQ